MRTQKLIGIFFILGSVSVLIPYTILTIMFEYPDILRQETAVILTKFHEGGRPLIWTWFAFAVAGLPLLPAVIMLGQRLEQQTSLARVATTIGVVGLVVQIVGLLRWTFVVPVIADAFVHADDVATKAAAVMVFKAIHQFAGVMLGEHIGQLFTIAWTMMISYIFMKLKLVPRWMSWFGFVSSFIYLLAQAELFGTVMTGIPVWDLAGFVGSTMWLVWMVGVGVVMIRYSKNSTGTTRVY